MRRVIAMVLVAVLAPASLAQSFVGVRLKEIARSQTRHASPHNADRLYAASSCFALRYAHRFR